jgi:hypothetical protein
MLSLSIAFSDDAVRGLVWYISRVKGQMLRLVGICLAWSILVTRVKELCHQLTIGLIIFAPFLSELNHS